MKKFTVIRRTVILLMILAVISGVVLYTDSNHPIMPNLTLTLLNGDLLSLETLRKNPLLIYFWATTCAVCIEEMPVLTKLYHEFSPQGFNIIGIAMYYDPPNRILSFTRNHHLPYFIAFDLERTAAQAFGDVKLVPVHFLIDQQGKIVYTRKGKLNEPSLKQHITRLLKDKK
jgi:peroxiredoxin